MNSKFILKRTGKPDLRVVGGLLSWVDTRQWIDSPGYRVRMALYKSKTKKYLLHITTLNPFSHRGERADVVAFASHQALIDFSNSSESGDLFWLLKILLQRAAYRDCSFSRLAAYREDVCKLLTAQYFYAHAIEHAGPAEKVVSCPAGAPA